jgi:hypothetical protein
MLNVVARRLLLSGWTRNDWRRIDGGTDYWVEPDVLAPVIPLREVTPDPEPSRARGRGSLADAKLMVSDGYSVERVSERTGWGAWWLTH